MSSASDGRSFVAIVGSRLPGSGGTADESSRDMRIARAGITSRKDGLGCCCSCDIATVGVERDEGDFGMVVVVGILDNLRRFLCFFGMLGSMMTCVTRRS